MKQYFGVLFLLSNFLSDCLNSMILKNILKGNDQRLEGLLDKDVLVK